MNLNQESIEEQFGQRMAEFGLQPKSIKSNGILYRFEADDDKRGKKSGWYVLYVGRISAGVFGNWKTDLYEKWSVTSDQKMTPLEKAEFRNRIELAMKKAESIRLELQAAAALACVKLLASVQDASDDNPYCLRKGIKPHGIKEFKGKNRVAIVPMFDETGAVVNLQFIPGDGVNKRFKTYGKVKGCYFWIGNQAVDTLIICEGFSTGASLHQITGYSVAVAFSAGNLEAVASLMSAKMPSMQIIICADNDRLNETGNVGTVKAIAAAKLIGASLAIPHFKSDEGKPTDFNDLHQIEGPEAVMIAVNAAKQVRTDNVLPESFQKIGNVVVDSNAPSSIDYNKTGQRIVKIKCGSDIKPLPISWLWDRWLPAGKLTILAGAAGTGKTTLTLSLGASITSGGKWPDGSRCRMKANILIWSGEDVAADTLVPRLIASGADLSRCHFIEGITEDGERSPFDPARDIFELHLAVEKMGGVALLIIDPIVSAVSGDMHKANDVRRSLQAVVDFAEVHQCAVIGITHFAKGGAGKAPQDRVIGSQAFGALARMVLVAAKEEDGSRRVLARAKSNIAPDDGGVAYSLNLATIEGGIEATHAVWEGVIEGTAREILGAVEHDDNGDSSSASDLEKMLIDLLIENGGKMPAKQMKAEVSDAGYSWTSANNAKAKAGIQSAKEPGSKTSSWYWYLPETVTTRISSTDKNPQESSFQNADSSDSCLRYHQLAEIQPVTQDYMTEVL